MRSGLVAGILLSLIQTSFADETVRGIVISNNMEDPSVGAYLHIQEEERGKDVVVVYTPPGNGTQEVCENKINPFFIGVGDLIEVQGTHVDQIGGVRVTATVISTCTQGAYITILNHEDLSRLVKR